MNYHRSYEISMQLAQGLGIVPKGVHRLATSVACGIPIETTGDLSQKAKFSDSRNYIIKPIGSNQ